MRGREKKRKYKIVLLSTCVLLGAVFFGVAKTEAARTFSEKFSKDGCIKEAGSMEKSANSNWWVNSGGKICFKKGASMTLQKRLSKNSKWSKLYRRTSPKDTDNGSRPQNIFRLVTRSYWQNFTQQAYFKIRKSNLSASDNRNASNGLLLLNRYLDSDNLYYAGVRVDGYAVIKKKIDGEYFTMAYKKFYGGKKYNVKSRPNLLPKKKSIGLKTEVRNTSEGNVEIKLYVANGQKRGWFLAAEALDEPGKYGGDVISAEGLGGIRTDFMDVEFDKYKISEL